MGSCDNVTTDRNPGVLSLQEGEGEGGLLFAGSLYVCRANPYVSPKLEDRSIETVSLSSSNHQPHLTPKFKEFHNLRAAFSRHFQTKP